MLSQNKVFPILRSILISTFYSIAKKRVLEYYRAQKSYDCIDNAIPDQPAGMENYSEVGDGSRWLFEKKGLVAKVAS